MKYLLFFIIFLPCITQASISLVGKGHVANIPIEMELDINDAGEVTGHYLYIKTKIPIQLKGNIVAREINLKTVGDPKIKETFIGTAIVFDGEVSRISGKWFGVHGADGKTANGYDFQVEGRTNPLLDHILTCEEMEQVPELAFEISDLGSGHSSPNEVDYECPKSLSQLEFLQVLTSNSDNIRGNAPARCTGSISSAHWRFFNYSLTHLGYYPESYSPNKDQDKRMHYFEEWSYQSLYNRKVYQDYMEELDRVKPLLSSWYIENRNIDKATADKFTLMALNRISGWGFGSYTYYWEPEALVPYTEQAIAGSYDNFISSLADSSEKQKLNSLNRILLHNPDTDFVKAILNSIETTKFPKRSETLLSNALNNPNLVELLLDKGFEVNHQNEFGKTALYYAVQFNLHDAVKVLLDNGADVNHKYQEENSWSCEYNIQQWDRTPLMHAAQHSDVAMLKLLIENGANLLSKDVEGSTAQDYAVKEGNTENSDYLESLL